MQSHESIRRMPSLPPGQVPGDWKRRACFVVYVGIVLALCIVGCNDASIEGEESLDHSFHSLNFAESVTEIQHRVSELRTEPAANSSSSNGDNLLRLIEIVEKLPVAAAESDLKKTDWDQVNAISKEMLVALRSTDREIPDLERMVSQLEMLVPLSGVEDHSQPGSLNATPALPSQNN